MAEAIRAEVVSTPAINRNNARLAISSSPRWKRSSLVDAAVEEVVRYDGPVQQATRIATEACTIAGQPVAKGDRVVLLVGAAHRDPAVYTDPDRFDMGRTGPGHLGFGAGLHHCIGASLARLETSIALSALLVLRPSPIDYQPLLRWDHRTLRRLKSFPVSLDKPCMSGSIA